MANTSIKFAGGVSAKDASAFAAEMRCDAEFVQDMRKRQSETRFACYVRNYTPHGVGITVPLGYVESQPVMDDEDYAEIVKQNRAKYCTIAEIELSHQSPTPTVHAKVEAPWRATQELEREARKEPHSKPVSAFPAAAEQPVLSEPRGAERAPGRLRRTPSVEPPPLGRGGKQHQYLQQVIKQAAEERNVRATIEEPLPDGGKVDVSLTFAEKRIACEVSVTTAREQELGNIEKCLGAGYSEVVVIGSSERHLNNARKFVIPHLDEADRDKVRFQSIENFLEYLDELAVSVAPTEGMVRGYKVRVTRRTVSEEEARTRRQAITQVIARSLKQLKDG